jgi:integrase
MAVAIEILTLAPMRISNLAQLDIDRNLVRTAPSGTMHIVIEPGTVKNGEALDFPLPSQSVELIERYLREFRPRLAPVGSTALFPGRSGGPKNTNGFAQQISDTIRSYAGTRVNVHLFRHIAAKLYLDSNPGGYEVVRRVLAHRSTNTTVRYYTGLETASAVRHFDATILKLRRETNKDDQDSRSRSRSAMQKAAGVARVGQRALDASLKGKRSSRRRRKSR